MVIGIEEFKMITEAMKTAEAEQIRAALLSLLDRGE